ncbi:MAG: uracil phosphoribosyltransferase [Peptococcaceae bacterium]|nr:uracil phosphoribosyltransferase [Peptococcaceae bacterium]
MKSVTVLRHPIVSDRLRTLRDVKTDTELFRRALRELSFFLAVEATSDLPSTPDPVLTPLGVEAPGETVDSSRVLLVPILRAGLGFVDCFLEFLPKAKVAHVGISRDHETLEAKVYMTTLPEKPDSFDRVYILDPMLATGNSSVKTMEILVKTGFEPEKIALVCGFAVEEGIRQVNEKYPAVRIITAVIDWKLNDVGYIVPGLGDAGDRLFLF